VKQSEQPNGYVWCIHEDNWIPKKACINMQRGYAPFRECKRCENKIDIPKGE